MSTTLIQTLKGIPSNENLPLFNAIRIDVADNNSILQNINIVHTPNDGINYKIKNSAFTFADNQGTPIPNLYEVELNIGTLFGNGYEIPANAIGTIIVSNIFSVSEISAVRGNFTLHLEDLSDCINLSTFIPDQSVLKVTGDISNFYNNNITELIIVASPNVYGNLDKFRDQYTAIRLQGTSISGDIAGFAKFKTAEYIWLTNTQVHGTIESLVAAFVAAGKTSGTVNLSVNGTSVTYQGRNTDKGADLIWNGVNNITYNAFN